MKRCITTSLLGVLTLSIIGQPITDIQYTKVGNSTTTSATVHCHNQKVFQNKQGIFMTYLQSRNDNTLAGRWRLLRSTDGGKTFKTVYTKVHKTNPPVIDGNPDGSTIYIMRSDYSDFTGVFYKFALADNYKKPMITKKVPYSSKGKYSAHYDPYRDRIYWMSKVDQFKILHLNGNLIGAYEITKDGNKAHMEYPHLNIDEKGKIHAAWTTDDIEGYHYRSIHYIKSNNGWDWKKMNGKNLKTPIVADPSGPTDQINLNDEINVHTWLGGFLVKDGKAHFVYAAQFKKSSGKAFRQHYVRYDIKTAKRDVDLYPDFKGDSLKIHSIGGFFASDKKIPNSTIYFVSHTAGTSKTVICLASDDNGETWYDYAQGDIVGSARSINGFREITSDRFIIGSFTDFKADDKIEVNFLKFKAGLSTAQLSSYSQIADNLIMEFDHIKGQPEKIRFSKDGEVWTKWIPFDTTIMVNRSALPEQTSYFQLRSKLKVKSEVFEIDLPSYETPRAINNSTICSGDSLFVGGQYQHEGGTYYDTLKSSYGFDSLIQETHLSVHIPTIVFDSTFICMGDSIKLAGAYRKAQGEYRDTLTGLHGCDSVIIQTNLIVNPTFAFYDTITICAGDSIFFTGSYQSAPGIYTDTFHTPMGCDSIHVIHLTIDSISYLNQSLAICEGESIILGGLSRYTTGIYYDTVQSINGCDSMVLTSSLNVYGSSITHNTINIIHGDSVFLGGAYQTTSGIYTDSLLSADGCDSLLQTELNVGFQASTTIEKSICAHDSIYIGGTWRKEAGNYDEVYKTHLGADSIVTTALSVQPASYSKRIDSICKGDSILIGSKYLSKPGVYYDTLQTIDACLEITKVFIEALSCNITGFNKDLQNNPQLQVRPNPSDGIFSIQIDQNNNKSRKYKAVLSDITGHRIESFSIENREPHTKNWSSLQSGIYLLEIDHMVVQRLIIRK